MENNINREQIINHIIEEFNLPTFQEHILREMWKTKSYLIPVRGNGWSSISALLTMIDLLLIEKGDN